jgi:putative ABC transport system permease protein
MFSDIRFAVRSFSKTPGFTAVLVLTLGLGIGASTAVFSVVNTVLLRPLPYEHPERLARICTEFPTYPNGGIRKFAASTPEYLYFKRELKSWQSVDAWATSGVNLATEPNPLRATASDVSGGLFASLGVAPAFGRAIVPKDDAPGAELVAVLSDGLWQRAFAGDKAVLGRDIVINGLKHTVVGVMPKGFSFPVGEADSTDVWSALQVDPHTTQFTGHNLQVLGRLKPGVTLPEAQAELDTLVANSVETSPGHHFDPKDHTLAAYGLQDDVVHGVRPALKILFGAVFFLLLIACVNAANLLLARAEARQREIAVRGALGAGIWRLARQFTVEGLLVSFVASALGLFLACAGIKLLDLASTAGIPRADQIEIDYRVVSFAMVVSCLTGVIFGFAPLVHVAKTNLYGAIKAAAASTTDAVGAQRFRKILVISQVALALILLNGTGLLLRAFWKLREVDAGFSPKGVTTAFVELPYSLYPLEKARNFWVTLQERLIAIPGVESASLSTALPPVVDTGVGFGLWIEGFSPTDKGAFPTVSTEKGPNPLVDHFHIINPDYFNALRIRLAAGRFFDARDGVQGPRVAIINQTMARAVWGNGNALGRHLKMDGEDEWRTVVGVIADVKNNGVDNPTGTEVYLPFSQGDRLNAVHIAVRSEGAQAAVLSSLRRVMHGIDPTLPLTKIHTMDEVISNTQSRPRFLTLLLTLFAGVALLLAAIGIYGVISYSVTLRTRESGIRLALGAQPRRVVGLVLQGGLTLMICGVLIGIIGSFAVMRMLSGFLFGIAPTDPATFLAVSMLLAFVSIVASYIPAHRATRVDPLVALRTE